MRRAFASWLPAASPPPPGALALLGFVAALLCLISERVLVRGGRCAVTDAALLDLQVAMGALASAAWRQVEAGEGAVPSAASTRRVEAALRALIVALRAFLTATARDRPPSRAIRRVRREARRAIPSLPTSDPAMRAGLARDGPARAPS